MAVVRFWYQTARVSLCLAVLLGHIDAKTANATAASEPPAHDPIHDPIQRLERHIEDLQGRRHDFEQQTYSATHKLLETSHGALAIQSPSARWDVFAPFPQTIVIADGELQIFDPDLEQLTVRSISGSWADVPLALLVNGSSLAAHFAVAEISPDVFQLKPHAYESLFRDLQIEFAQDRLVSIQIVDQVDQLTVIRFAPQSPDQVIQSGHFELELPPGTEVVKG